MRIDSAPKPLVIVFLGLFTCSAGLLFSRQTQTPASEEVRVYSSAYWPRSQFTLRVDARLVEVEVVVRDGQGRTIGGLQRDDFDISDDGKKREIKAFSVETSSRAATVAPPAQPTAAAAPPGQPAAAVQAPPRFVALMIDDLSLGFSELVRVKTAARRFLSEGLSTGDRMGIFTTSGETVLPFTSDVPNIIDTIDKFNSSPRIPSGGLCPHLTPYDAYVIANKMDPTALAVKATKENFIIGKESGIELALKEPTFERMAKNGLNVTLTLKAPRGPYTLPSVVQDSLDRKTAASTLSVAIR